MLFGVEVGDAQERGIGPTSPKFFCPTITHLSFSSLQLTTAFTLPKHNRSLGIYSGSSFHLAYKPELLTYSLLAIPVVPPAPVLEALAFTQPRNQHHAFLSSGAAGEAKRRWLAIKVGTAVHALATRFCH